MVCSLFGRGAGAEDPFRGLRAGPVRSSPLFFSTQVQFRRSRVFRTFADLPKTPQTHPIGEGVPIRTTSSLQNCSEPPIRAKTPARAAPDCRVYINAGV